MAHLVHSNSFWGRSFLTVVCGFCLLGVASAEEKEKIGTRIVPFKIAVGEFEGSSGKTAARALRADLVRSGYFSVSSEDSEGAFKVVASSSGGRISGEVLGPAGERVFRSEYGGNLLLRNVHHFADDIVSSVVGKVGISTSKIAFVSDKGSRHRIYLCDYDGTNLQQITQPGLTEVSPELAVSGRVVWHVGYRDGSPSLFMTNLVTGLSQKVIDAPGIVSEIALSPDGEQLALVMSFLGQVDLFIARPADGHLARITESSSVEFGVSWAPDGKRLIYVSDDGQGGSLRISRLDNGRSRGLNVGYSDCRDASWSPNGRLIAFSVAGEARSQGIVVYDLDSREAKQVRGDGAGEAVWGPSGKHLLFTRDGDLFLYDVETTVEHPVMKEMGTISEPSWSRY